MGRWREPGDRPSWVYFVERDGLIKIGVSIDPYTRVRGYKGVLLALIPGDHSIEYAHHKRFAHLLAKGNEWFSPGGDLLEYVASLPQPPAMEDLPKNRESTGVTKYDRQLVTRISADQKAALEADAEAHGRTPTQSARFAIDFYLAATPPVTVTAEVQNGGNGNG
jgi:hypothetical protein